VGSGEPPGVERGCTHLALGSALRWEDTGFAEPPPRAVRGYWNKSSRVRGLADRSGANNGTEFTAVIFWPGVWSKDRVVGDYPAEADAERAGGKLPREITLVVFELRLVFQPFRGM